METIVETISDYFTWLTLPAFKFTDVLEILILAFLIYNIIKWIKYTRAWTLFKGLLVLLAFSVFSAIMQFDVILWIIRNTISVGIIAFVILFQPELRRALEELGKRNIFPKFISLTGSDENDRFSDKTIEELVKASFELARNKTGALIVIEKDLSLTEYEKSGIPIDAVVSSQLLINIFEHNTPLHDGAVIISGGRVMSACSILPLAVDSDINKSFGTRHRAAIGISKNSDAIAVVVSEETGKISVARNNMLTVDIKEEGLKKLLLKYLLDIDLEKETKDNDNILLRKMKKVKEKFRKKEMEQSTKVEKG